MNARNVVAAEPSEEMTNAAVIDLAEYRRGRRLLEADDIVEACHWVTENVATSARRTVLSLVRMQGRVEVKALAEAYACGDEDEWIEVLSVITSMVLKGELQADFEPLTRGMRRGSIWLPETQAVRR